MRPIAPQLAISAAHAVPSKGLSLNTEYAIKFLGGVLVLYPITHLEDLNDGLQNLVAGGIAGVVSRTITAPMDRIRIVLQAGVVGPHHVTIPKDLKGMSIAEKSRILRTARTIYLEGGLIGFFKGNAANIMKVTPETAIKFYANQKLMDAINRDKNNIKTSERFLSGATAGLVAQSMVYPLEVVRTRMALSKPGQYRSILHCMSCTVRDEGMRKMYRGLAPSLLGIVPYAGVELTTFNTVKDWYRKKYSTNHVPVPYLLMFGGLSSIVAQAVSYPLQLIRTRLQAQGMPGRPVQYNGMVDCFRQVIRQEGLVGLYRGILPGSVKTVPAIGISYTTFETVKSRLGIEKSEQKAHRH